MHDWKGFLQSIQRDESTLPPPSSSSSFTTATIPPFNSLPSTSIINPGSETSPTTGAVAVSSGVRSVYVPHTVRDCALSEVVISRCTYGELFVRAPTYNEVLYRLDTVYLSYSRAVKIVAGILGRGKSESDEMEGKIAV